MNSLFNQAGTQEIINRINSLTPDSKGQWGKMSINQMLAHCRKPLEAAHGNIKGKRPLISYLFGAMAKKQIIANDQAFKKNLPTDKNFIVANPEEFAKEKEALIKQLQLFCEKGAQAITSHPHSFFGKMTPQEWDVLQYKHLDHHLKQFAA